MCVRKRVCECVPKRACAKNVEASKRERNKKIRACVHIHTNKYVKIYSPRINPIMTTDNVIIQLCARFDST